MLKLSRQTIFAGTVALLCFCVLMQLLGAPTSLWSMELEEDLLEGSILEDLSIPAAPIGRGPVAVRFLHSHASHTLSGVLLARFLFRPPCSAA